MTRVYVQGLSVRGPGLDGWQASRAILTAHQDYVPRPANPLPVTLLAANERRRAGAAVRLALSVAAEASEMAGIPAGGIPSLFATSNGDGAVLDPILRALAAGEAVSPTQFHNSVHNAAAGYWSIATGSRESASCLAGHDFTAAAALVKTASAVHTERRPVLLCVYDLPMPEPLAAKRPTLGSFGAALILAPEATAGSLASLDLAWRARPADRDAIVPCVGALRDLAEGNAAARLVRLLEAIAHGGGELALPLLDGNVCISVRPCSTASGFSR